MSEKLSKQARRQLESGLADVAAANEIADAIDNRHIKDFLEVQELLVEVKEIASFTEKVEFETAATLTINYAIYPSRPSVEAWVLQNGQYMQADPCLSYDDTSKTVSVSFGDNYETGYLILK